MMADRYYIDHHLRCELMKEDETDCSYNICDTENYFHCVVAEVHHLDLAEKIVELLNNE